MNDMGLDYLPGTISVEAEDGMNMLTISVSSNDPQLAYDTLTSVIKNYPEVAEYYLRRNLFCRYWMRQAYRRIRRKRLS